MKCVSGSSFIVSSADCLSAGTEWQSETASHRPLKSLHQCPEALSTQHPRISPNRSCLCVVQCESLRWLPCCQSVRPCVPALTPLHAHLPCPGLPSVVSAGSVFYPTAFLTVAPTIETLLPPLSLASSSSLQVSAHKSLVSTEERFLPFTPHSDYIMRPFAAALPFCAFLSPSPSAISRLNMEG